MCESFCHVSNVLENIVTAVREDTTHRRRGGRECVISISQDHSKYTQTYIYQYTPRMRSHAAACKGTAALRGHTLMVHDDLSALSADKISSSVCFATHRACGKGVCGGAPPANTARWSPRHAVDVSDSTKRRPARLRDAQQH